MRNVENFTARTARDADPKLLYSSGMKGCPAQVFRVLCSKLPCQTLQLYNMNCNISLRQNSSSDLISTYMDNSSKYKTTNNNKMICCYYPCIISGASTRETICIFAAIIMLRINEMKQNE